MTSNAPRTSVACPALPFTEVGGKGLACVPASRPPAGNQSTRRLCIGDAMVACNGQHRGRSLGRATGGGQTCPSPGSDGTSSPDLRWMEGRRGRATAAAGLVGLAGVEGGKCWIAASHDGLQKISVRQRGSVDRRVPTGPIGSKISTSACLPPQIGKPRDVLLPRLGRVSGGSACRWRETLGSTARAPAGLLPSALFPAFR